MRVLVKQIAIYICAAHTDTDIYAGGDGCAQNLS